MKSNTGAANYFIYQDNKIQKVFLNQEGDVNIFGYMLRVQHASISRALSVDGWLIEYEEGGVFYNYKDYKEIQNPLSALLYMYDGVTANGVPYTEDLINSDGMGFILYPLSYQTDEDIKQAKSYIKGSRDAVKISVASDIDKDDFYRSLIFKHPATKVLKWYEINADNRDLIRECRINGVTIEEYVEKHVLPNIAETATANGYEVSAVDADKKVVTKDDFTRVNATGSGHPEPADIFEPVECKTEGVTLRKSRYMSFDDGLINEFEVMINEYLKEKKDSIVFDARHTNGFNTYG